MANLMTVAEYAAKSGVTPMAIYQRIGRNRISVTNVQIGGGTQAMIDLETNPISKATSGRKRKGVSND